MLVAKQLEKHASIYLFIWYFCIYVFLFSIIYAMMMLEKKIVHVFK